MKRVMILSLIISTGIIMHAAESNRVATFAGGCFWCMEPAFEKLTGVKNVVAGYAGGTGPNPTYKDYARKRYVEAVQITYDPSRISYAELLNTFWKQIDPTDQDGQFVDRGKQYRSAIFYHTPTQKQEAEQSKQKLAQSHRFAKPIVTEIIPATNFYPAEEYHQDYAQKNPVRYWWYRRGSGRDQFIKTNWSTPKNHTSSDHQSKVGTLTQLQRSVTQEGGTEPPFKNAYWDNTKPGIYVDIVSGEPLFSSTDKFKSGTGWPSFTKPINPDAVVLKKQWSLFGTRIEVKSKKGNSHLGDLFYDGPAPAGTRYCINSAALRFIPVADLQKEGYGTYLPLFSQAESA